MVVIEMRNQNNAQRSNQTSSKINYMLLAFTQSILPFPLEDLQVTKPANFCQAWRNTWNKHEEIRKEIKPSLFKVSFAKSNDWHEHLHEASASQRCWDTSKYAYISIYKYVLLFIIIYYNYCYRYIFRWLGFCLGSPMYSPQGPHE